MKIKICGITDRANLEAIIPLRPDFVGFIFYPQSKRYMGNRLQPPDLIAVPGTIRRTGVFVNENIDTILTLANAYGLQALQVHGDETAEYVCRLKKAIREDILVIKAFGIDGEFDWNSLNDYQECCDMFLFDAKTPYYGGSGRRFDPGLLAHYTLKVPVMVAGGIGLEELDEILMMQNKSIAAVDMNSRLEKSPGVKDIALVGEAIRKVRMMKDRSL